MFVMLSFFTPEMSTDTDSSGYTNDATTHTFHFAKGVERIVEFKKLSQKEDFSYLIGVHYNDNEEPLIVKCHSFHFSDGDVDYFNEGEKKILQKRNSKDIIQCTTNGSIVISC